MFWFLEAKWRHQTDRFLICTVFCIWGMTDWLLPVLEYLRYEAIFSRAVSR